MKLKAMHLFRVLYADPFWRWWGKKVCILAARYYLGIDSIDDFKRRVHIGGRRYERPTQASLLNGKQRRWIKDNEEKVRGVIHEVAIRTIAKALQVPVSEELLLEKNRSVLQAWCEKCYQREAEYQGYRLVSGVTLKLPANSKLEVTVQGWVEWFDEEGCEWKTIAIHADIEVADDHSTISEKCKKEFSRLCSENGHELVGEIVIESMEDELSEERVKIMVRGRIRKAKLIENT